MYIFGKGFKIFMCPQERVYSPNLNQPYDVPTVASSICTSTIIGVVPAYCLHEHSLQLQSTPTRSCQLHITDIALVSLDSLEPEHSSVIPLTSKVNRIHDVPDNMHVRRLVL